MDGLWATKSEGVGLIVREISFQDFQLGGLRKTIFSGHMHLIMHRTNGHYRTRTLTLTFTLTLVR